MIRATLIDRILISAPKRKLVEALLERFTPMVEGLTILLDDNDHEGYPRYADRAFYMDTRAFSDSVSSSARREFQMKPGYFPFKSTAVPSPSP